MKTIVDLILLALITIYIVDLSGFTDTWLKALSAYKGRKIGQLKPFSCRLCMVAFSALLSMMSVPIGQLLMLIREAILKAINLLMELL